MIPGLTPRRAVWIAAAVAVAVYANAVLNAWAGDDVLVVLTNARTHSAGSALQSWFLSYWPPPYEDAGLYRPLAILSYGVEWSLSGGRPWLFHLDNVLLHGAATALAVLVALQWLPPLGALAAGLVFAVHPVHVEAVSNVVGRAELLAATAMLSALLAARQFRHAADGRMARRWLALCAGCVMVGLFSKEHAAIAVAVIGLDHLLDPAPARRHSWGLYLAVTTVTIGWLFLWRAIAGSYVAAGATTALYGLSRWERISHMMPVQLDVLRLLAWPADLAGDYSPMTIPIRREWGGLAWLGFLAATAFVALGLATIRRVPAVAFGILLAAGSYLPTSNIFFPSGVVLAERALYLAVFAPALVVGWLAVRLANHPARRVALVAAGLLLVVAGAHTFARTPYWKDAATPIIGDLAGHPENYRSHLHAADFIFKRDSARALAEFLAGAELDPIDPFIAFFTVRTAIGMGRLQVALQEAHRVHGIAPDDPRTGRWLSQAFEAAKLPDSAVTTALHDAMRQPSSIGFVHTFQNSLEHTGAPKWRLVLAGVADDWLSGRLVQAAAGLDSLELVLPSAERAPSFCDDLVIIVTPARALRPELLSRAMRSCGGLRGDLAK